jgi:hypothetical protein
VELDRVGPVDNRPSTDYLHHFVKKKNKKNTWHMVGGEHSLTISAPQLLRFGIDSVLEYFEQKDDLMNLWATKLFIEQPWLHRVC